MKAKDIEWYNKKLKSIKRRKKIFNRIEDTTVRKKLKGELKREHRSVKRAERENARQNINNEINENYGD